MSTGGWVSGWSNSSTVASYPLATRASSSSRPAPKPARRIRWAINAMSSWYAMTSLLLWWITRASRLCGGSLAHHVIVRSLGSSLGLSGLRASASEAPTSRATDRTHPVDGHVVHGDDVAVLGQGRQVYLSSP